MPENTNHENKSNLLHYLTLSQVFNDIINSPRNQLQPHQRVFQAVLVSVFVEKLCLEGLVHELDAEGKGDCVI